MRTHSTASFYALALIVVGLAACEGRTGLSTPAEARPCPGRSYDCDGDAENGCEVDLANDPKSCGACGKRCDDGLSCSEGACVPGNTLVQIDSMISTQFVRKRVGMTGYTKAPANLATALTDAADRKLWTSHRY